MLVEDKELKLEPFIHQVGGHSPLFCLDPVTVCKPLEQRELNFYSSLPRALLPFTPHFKGSMQVEISEDTEGYIQLTGSPPTTYRRRCSRRRSDYKPRMRLKRNQSIEIETEAPSDQFFEDEMVKGEKTYNPWALKCHRDNLKKMGIHLVKSIELSPTFQEFILLENLTYKCKNPCVLDLKVGTRQYGDEASDSKRLSKNAKVAKTTSGALGLRLGGMQVFQANLGRFICRTKNYGRTLNVDGLKLSLRQFFCNGLVMRLDVIKTLLRKLVQLKEVVENLESYRFYTSSLLVIYDGSFHQTGSHSRCCEEVEPQTRNSLSTSSLLQLSGRCASGSGPVVLGAERSRSLDHISRCHQFHRSIDNKSIGMGSRKKSVSYDSISSLSNSPEGRARSVAMASDVDKLVDVKIIDFAHSTHRGLRDATLHEGPDLGFLLGLENLILVLREMMDNHKFAVTL